MLLGTWALYSAIALISKKYIFAGGMAPSEWTRSVTAIRGTTVTDYSPPGLNTMRHIAYRPPITVSQFLLALLVVNVK